MKTIELKGGPFDGEVLGFSGPEAAAYFIIAAGHPERPVYRCSCCSCCAADMDVVDYHFVGYECMFKKGELDQAQPRNQHHRGQA